MEPTIRVVLLPRDTNAGGTIFGGVILSHLDLAGAAEARKHGRHRYVTVAIREVEFKRPVYVGDLVSFYATTLKVGRTSVTVHVDVVAERADAPDVRAKVTEAELVFVAVDEAGRPIAIQKV